MAIEDQRMNVSLTELPQPPNMCGKPNYERNTLPNNNSRVISEYLLAVDILYIRNRNTFI